MYAILGGIVNHTIKPILHQLDYLFHYERNIKEVEKKLEILTTTKDRVQILVSQDRGKGNAIFDGVTKWLDNVKEELNMSQQSEGVNNPSCFNFVQRHQVSRKAKKKAEKIIELLSEGNQFNKDNVGYPVPSRDTNSPTLPTDYQIIESRTSVIEKINDTLANPTVNKVGVCGMGGIGKTALLNEVKKLVLEKNLFDRVIQVEVGQSKSVFKIQEEIRGKLNIVLDMQCEVERASRLRTHIIEKKENILFMLDDLWKEYDLEKEFGIPCRSESVTEGCKILMTSRSKDTLNNQMNAEKLFEVNSLTKKESWKFFVAIVGTSAEDVSIQQVAKDVVKECGGLPIALKILAKALKGKRVEIWKDALRTLKNHVVVNILGVSEQLYSCLQFSYNSIEDEAQLIFLLCSVFPDDHKIQVKDLQTYAMGMGLLKQINTWERTRNRVIKLVDDLKSSYLLLEPDGEVDYVQMHDVVHDFAKYIASKEDKMKSLTYGSGQREWQEDDRHSSYNAIYIDSIEDPNLSLKIKFPNLKLLVLTNRNFFYKFRQIDLSSFIEDKEVLRVFDVRDLFFQPSSWTSITHSLNNLQILCFSSCGFIDIDAISQVKQLKVLKIENCEIIELGDSIRELTQLKVLHVLDCSGFKEVHSNITANMVKLEELHFHGYIMKKLFELDNLSCLFNLELSIQNVVSFSSELNVERARKLEEFRINFGNTMYFRRNERRATSLMFGINSHIDSIDGVLQILLQKCEVLDVEDSMSFTKLLCNKNYCYPRLKELQIHINDQNQVLEIENIATLHLDLQVSSPHLMDLKIDGSKNLETLWRDDGLTSNSFCKLQKICITKCNTLTYVFPARMVRLLAFLNTLQVNNCELVETIFEIKERSDDVDQEVPLTILELCFLPNLKHVWNNDPTRQLLTFRNLKKVNIVECPQLRTIFPASFINHMKEIERLDVPDENEIFPMDEVLQLESHQIILFPSLIFLRISCKMMKRRSCWVRSDSFSILRDLHLTGFEEDVQLATFPLEMSALFYRIQRLTLGYFFELVQVFPNHNQSTSGGAKLKYLELYNLPKLRHVWEDDTDQMTLISCRFDNLEYIKVEGCENLKCLVSPSITFLNLTCLIVIDCNGMVNLFTSSVAKNLVNLQELRIENCTKMSYIVVAPQGEEENNTEEIIFDQLNYLVLHNLPRLVSYHYGKCTLKFPRLQMLDTYGCPVS